MLPVANANDQLGTGKWKLATLATGVFGHKGHKEAQSRSLVFRCPYTFFMFYTAKTFSARRTKSRNAGGTATNVRLFGIRGFGFSPRIVGAR